MNVTINLAPSWGEWGNIFYSFALDGMQGPLKALRPDLAKALAAAEAFNQIQPSLTADQFRQATEVMESELWKQGFPAPIIIEVADGGKDTNTTPASPQDLHEWADTVIGTQGFYEAPKDYFMKAMGAFKDQDEAWQAAFMMLFVLLPGFVNDRLQRSEHASECSDHGSPAG